LKLADDQKLRTVAELELLKNQLEGAKAELSRLREENLELANRGQATEQALQELKAQKEELK
jgi:chromosome segregation ATPase